jgi:pyrroloquinoline quinone biosynthesis protein D
VLRLGPHARFRFDQVRQSWIVLMPERLLLPDEQAVAVLRLVDDDRSADAIVDMLSAQYQAPRAVIAGDGWRCCRTSSRKRYCADDMAQPVTPAAR